MGLEGLKIIYATEILRHTYKTVSYTHLLYIKEEENYHKIFSLYDGIPGYIFNFPVQITDDNTVWWGNERGLVCYDAVKSWSEIGTKRSSLP